MNKIHWTDNGNRQRGKKHSESTIQVLCIDTCSQMRNGTWYIDSIQFWVISIRFFLPMLILIYIYTWYSSLLSPLTFIHCVFMNSCRIKVFLFIELISWCCFHFSGVHIKISNWQIPHLKSYVSNFQENHSEYCKALKKSRWHYMIQNYLKGNKIDMILLNPFLV